MPLLSGNDSDRDVLDLEVVEERSALAAAHNLCCTSSLFNFPASKPVKLVLNSAKFDVDPEVAQAQAVLAMTFVVELPPANFGLRSKPLSFSCPNGASVDTALLDMFEHS